MTNNLQKCSKQSVLLYMYSITIHFSSFSLEKKLRVIVYLTKISMFPRYHATVVITFPLDACYSCLPK